MLTELDLQTVTVQHKHYKHTSDTIVATKEMMMKNSSETIVKQEYVKKNIYTKGNIFNIKVISENIGEGSATGKINKDMNALINNLTVGTDKSGNIQTIFNTEEIEDKWARLKKRWRKETDRKDREQLEKTIDIVEDNLSNGSFVKEIAEQGVLHFLLHGLYGDYTEDLVVEKDLSKFLITQPLPLNITYRMVSFDVETRQVVIEGTGVLAEERLDKKTLTKLIRTIKDKINLKVELQVDYRERFEFDTHHWLSKAKQQVKVKIPGFYMTESKQEITETELV